MRQQGNVLLVLLVLMAVIASMSIELFTSSLQEFKANEHYNQRFDAFYQTEHCLQKIMLKHFSVPANSSLFDVAIKPLSWWKKHGNACGESSWYYIQSINSETALVSAYHSQHILLQTIVKKDLQQHWHSTNWLQR